MRDCEHGRLARSCEICELTAERDEARADAARWKAEAEEMRRERDLAIAHDRQPYPTADAYEAACAALHKWKAEADRLREALLSPFEARAVLVALSFGVPDPMPQEIRDARSKIAGMERAALSAGGGTES